MDLRFRGKTSAESVAFWYVVHPTSLVMVILVLTVAVVDDRLCEGRGKRPVRANKTRSLSATVAEWELSHVLEQTDVHFLNESTGLVVPQDEEIGKWIADRDVLRLCTATELAALQEKFATRDAAVTHEMMKAKATTPMGAALYV